MAKVCREYNLATVAQLKSRMPDMGLMSSMCHMFDCHQYPESADNFDAVDAHMKTVLSHYNGMGHGLGDNLVDAGWSEWQRFRLDMHKHRQEQVTEHKTIRKTVGADGQRLKQPVVTKVTRVFPKPVMEILKDFLAVEANWVQYPHICLLICIYIVFASTSCDAKRAFSALKLVKTALRNRMTQALLQQLMQIVLNGPKLAEEAKCEEIIERALTY